MLCKKQEVFHLRTSIKDGQQNKEWSNSLIFNGMKKLKVGTHIKRNKTESKKNSLAKNYTG